MTKSEPLVWNGNPTDRYHITNSDGEIACGEKIAKKIEFTDPGDAIKQCPECRRLTAFDKMTNDELVEWLADECNFEIPNRDVPAYMSSQELRAICRHIRNLTEQ